MQTTGFLGRLALRNAWVISGLVLSVFLTSCGSNSQSTPAATTPASSSPQSQQPPQTGTASGRAAGNGDAWFEALGSETGLAFNHFNGMSGQYYFPETLPPGVALFDYDNDGDLDVYLVQGDMLPADRPIKDALYPPPSTSPLTGRLFRNDLVVGPDGRRTLHFTDVTEQSGLNVRGYGMGVAAGDFNNDGCVDLYLTFYGRNRLYKNNCNGTFSDVSAASHTDGVGWSVSAAFVDYDRDGWLDLYVGNYVQYDITKDQTCKGLTGKRDYCTPAVYTSQPDRLYHNNRNGTFTDVSSKALLGGTFGPALGVATADFNNDGWIDIYVTNDTKPNLLWINQHDGTFRESALLAGAALTADGKAEASMGVDAGDFDNDGDEDLFMTELPAQGSNLFVNDGTGRFEDLSARTGIGAMSLGFSGFGAGWVDVDNDGWLDLVQVNGSIETIEGQTLKFPYAEHKLLFHNTGKGRFTDATAQAGPAFMALEVSRGMAMGDIDNDGDVDLIVNNLNGTPRILINHAGNAHHWTCARLVGVGGRDMLGAQLELIRKQGPTLYRRARADGSYGAANDPRVLAGLGDSTEVPSARVRWPDGSRERWAELPIDRCTTLTQGKGQRE